MSTTRASTDELLEILRDLEEDKGTFEKPGVSFEEKAFYDILVKVRDEHNFPYEEEKCLALAKQIKELVDDKAQHADWGAKRYKKPAEHESHHLAIQKMAIRRSGTRKYSRRLWNRQRISNPDRLAFNPHSSIRPWLGVWEVTKAWRKL